MPERPVVAILCDFPYWLVNNDLPAQGGHYAVWLLALHEALRESDEFDIHWITLTKAVSRVTRFSSANQHFHLIPRGSRIIGLCSAYAVDRWRLARELKVIRPDLLHTWGTEDCYALAGTDFRGQKLLSMQGVLTAYQERARLPRFQQVQSLYEKYAVRFYQHITAESQWAADRTKEIAPQADMQLFEYAPNEVFFRMKRMPSTTPTCFLAGTDTPVKNVASAIRAFSRPELAHVTLFMAGIEPANHPDIPSNIVALGRISQVEIAEYLTSCWALIHPSLADSCPNIVKEARAMGIPAVVTTECGAKQYILHGQSGYVIPPNDDEALVQAVLSMTRAQEDSLRMGAFDCERCREALSRQTMTRRLCELYRGLLATE